MPAGLYWMPLGHLPMLSYNFCHLIYWRWGIILMCVLLTGCPCLPSLWACVGLLTWGCTGHLRERCSEAWGLLRGPCTLSSHSQLFLQFFAVSIMVPSRCFLSEEWPPKLLIEGGMIWFQVQFILFLEILLCCFLTGTSNFRGLVRHPSISLTTGYTVLLFAGGGVHVKFWYLLLVQIRPFMATSSSW